MNTHSVEDVFYFVEGKGGLHDLTRQKAVDISSVGTLKSALLPKVAPGTYAFHFRDSEDVWSEEMDDLPPPKDPKGRVTVKLTPHVSFDPTPLPGTSQTTVDFWNSLPQAKITLALKEEQKGKGKQQGETTHDSGSTFLELEPGVFFLGDEKLGSNMFVRECYKELAEVTMQIIDSGYNLVIAGNPGIGKSYFLFYFMHYLHHVEREPIVIP